MRAARKASRSPSDLAIATFSSGPRLHPRPRPLDDARLRRRSLSGGHLHVFPRQVLHDDQRGRAVRDEVERDVTVRSLNAGRISVRPQYDEVRALLADKFA